MTPPACGPRARKLLPALASALACALAASAVPAVAQIAPGCQTGKPPEVFGPTDINAVSGNQGLTAGVNREGTVTVLKWPSPSYYDQIDYRTTKRGEPRMGADANHGAFVGLAWRRGSSSDWSFSWIRNWPSNQRFADADGDVVVTTFRNKRAGLTVSVSDVVAAGMDAFVRRVHVARTRNSKARQARVFSFANFNPVFSKTAGSPTDDWCEDAQFENGARYLLDRDAIVVEASGVDGSTNKNSSVALAMGFTGRSDGFQIGADPGDSAYKDSLDAHLDGKKTGDGETDTALSQRVSLSDRSGTATVVIAAARDRKRALGTLKEVRARGSKRILKQKASWWRDWLRAAPLPKKAPGAVEKLAKRSLISIRQATDRHGLVVSSIATQSPLGLDWIRHGAYINEALVASRHASAARRHSQRYTRLQAEAGDTDGTPIGNWPTSTYADGVRGSTTDYEIDETGYAIWTLWRGFAHPAGQYRSDAYGAIQPAAHYLSELGGCIDVTNNLQCAAPEEDGTTSSQTIVGAQAVWLGLDAAVDAARFAVANWGHGDDNVTKWTTRRNSLRNAIEAEFFDDTCACYTKNHLIGGTLLWPVQLVKPGTKAANDQAAQNWIPIQRSIEGDRRAGGMEARTILGNAYAWRGNASKMAKVKRALTWLATRTTTRTNLLGGAWRRHNGGTTVMLSQPHVWHHSMFYLAALKAYGKAPYDFRG